MKAVNAKIFSPGFRARKTLKLMRVADERQPFYPERGGRLSRVTVAYETYGELSPAGDNVILVLHALTGDSHCAAHEDGDEEGWWELLVGPGRPIDTDRFFVICSNVLGGCQGTTGPSSCDPDTGKPYGMSFPTVTIRDMVRVQKLLLDQLGIRKLLMTIGGSMGGMQALEWGVTYPEMAGALAVIAAPGYASAQAIAFNHVGRNAVMLDPAWRGGDYYGTAGPAAGLGIARGIGMITYQSESSMGRKFGRNRRSGRFEIENYLDYQGDSLVRRFDANTYLCLLKALDLHDVGESHASYAAALGRIRGKVLVVGVSSDILYPESQQLELAELLARQGVAVEYARIDSTNGHDGFLIDFDLLRPVLERFVGRVAGLAVPGWIPQKFRAGRLAYLGARLVSQGIPLDFERDIAGVYP